MVKSEILCNCCKKNFEYGGKDILTTVFEFDEQGNEIEYDIVVCKNCGAVFVLCEKSIW